jgi:4,5-dihydroxyphthalate decarboxylase
VARVDLTLACGPYDRTAALADGRIRPEGIDLNVVQLEPEEIFWRMARHAEFDVSEMSLSSYTVAVARGDSRLVGLPVFVSRSFRHSSIYLRADSDIQDPAALKGARIGVPEYQMTASIWTRGFLADDHGVGAEDVTWVTGGMEQPGRAERQPLQLPDSIITERLVDRTLTEALLAGDIDALLAPRVPSVFRRPGPPVRRLFPDYAAREREYFGRTGLFPIMHLVVLRSDVHERHPWAAQSLTKAFVAAKELAIAGIENAPALRWTLPLLLDAVERGREIFGDDPWPYGLEANREALVVFLRYMREQGLTDRELVPEELFAPSTHLEARI